MNIFVLHHKPGAAARMMCDQHIVKMPTEQAQMLCFVHHLRNPRKKWVERNIAFKLNASHAKHPCTEWLMEDPRNYAWGYRLLRAMLKEYDHRYDGLKDGKFSSIIAMLPALRRLPSMDLRVQDILDEPDDFVLAVNKVPECITDCAVETYRRFYIADKHEFARWKHRPAPEWFVRGREEYLKTSDISQVSIL